MQPDQPLNPKPSHRAAAWLNGITWVVIVLIFLWLLTLQGYEALMPLGLIWLVAAHAAVLNFVVCLYLYATGHGQQAHRYLIGCIPLVLLCWAVGGALSGFHKIGG